MTELLAIIVLDTNVVSELMRDSPQPQVLSWLDDQLASTLFVTAITEADLRYGVEILPAGLRRDRLSAEIEGTHREDFAGLVLPFYSAAARTYAVIAAGRCAAG